VKTRQKDAMRELGNVAKAWKIRVLRNQLDSVMPVVPYVHPKELPDTGFIVHLLVAPAAKQKIQTDQLEHLLVVQTRRFIHLKATDQSDLIPSVDGVAPVFIFVTLNDTRPETSARQSFPNSYNDVALVVNLQSDSDNPPLATKETWKPCADVYVTVDGNPLAESVRAKNINACRRIGELCPAAPQLVVPPNRRIKFVVHEGTAANSALPNLRAQFAACASLPVAIDGLDVVSGAKVVVAVYYNASKDRIDRTTLQLFLNEIRGQPDHKGTRHRSRA
jgi:hypothetical protein